MKTAFITHDDCILHDMGSQHPESPVRLRAINQHLIETGLDLDLIMFNATPAQLHHLERVHPAAHVAQIRAKQPASGIVSIDPDTSLCPHSIRAADLAAGAVVQAVDDILAGKYQHAFCATRPPGHHAEQAISMGFCVFNNVAVGVKHALAQEGIERVAVLDFDVHHGNGTVDIFKDDPRVLVCSSFQSPFYPNRYQDILRPNIVNSPLQAGDGSLSFRQAINEDWLPALETHQPQFIFVSAGFDAHRDDPLGGLNLLEEDYAWVTDQICQAAIQYADGRIASVLEGGYDPDALSRSVVVHVGRMLELKGRFCR